MSKEDAKDIPLRELVRQSVTMIEQHKRDSEKFRFETSVLLGKISVHNEYTEKTLIDHDKQITILEAYRNKTYGVIAVIGVIFGAIAGWLLSLIAK